MNKLLTDAEVDEELARIRARRTDSRSATIRLTRDLIAARTTTVTQGQSLLLMTPASPIPEGVRIDDFAAYMPTHTYIFKPTREMWPASSVNARIPPIAMGDGKPVPASSWLDSNKPVEQATWAPGEPMEIEDKLVAADRWVERKGCRVFNFYRPPRITPKIGRCSAVA